MINYQEIVSVVEYAREFGLISDPIPMTRDTTVIESDNPMSPQMQICQSRRDEIINWYDKGWTQKAIANELGMSSGPVSKFFKAEGISFVVGVYKRDPNKTYGRPRKTV